MDIGMTTTNIDPKKRIAKLTYNGVEIPLPDTASAFEEGIQSEYDRFWDTIQNNGNPTSYAYRFLNFPAALFNPKYDFVMDGVDTTSASWSFRLLQATDMKKNCDFTRVTHMQYTFYQSNIKNARTIKVSPANLYKDTFAHCVALEEIRIDGEIGQNGLSFSTSRKLTHDSLMSIINCLEAKTEGTWTVTLGATNLAKLTDAEKAIATQKGWTLA
jgi:hypothetical protein